MELVDGPPCIRQAHRFKFALIEIVDSRVLSHFAIKAGGARQSVAVLVAYRMDRVVPRNDCFSSCALITDMTEPQLKQMNRTLWKWCFIAGLPQHESSLRHPRFYHVWCGICGRSIFLREVLMCIVVPGEGQHFLTKGSARHES